MHFYPSAEYITSNKFHDCPSHFKDLIDPALRSLRLGPGFCTADNLYGLSYLLLLMLNYAFAFIAFCAVWKAMSRFRWCRAMFRILQWRSRGLETMQGDEDVARAERGERKSAKVGGECVW